MSSLTLSYLSKGIYDLIDLNFCLRRPIVNFCTIYLVYLVIMILRSKPLVEYYLR